MTTLDSLHSICYDSDGYAKECFMRLLMGIDSDTAYEFEHGKLVLFGFTSEDDFWKLFLSIDEFAARKDDVRYVQLPEHKRSLAVFC